MLRIEPRLAFINGVLLANRVLIFRFQLLAVYVLLVHNCGECRIARMREGSRLRESKNYVNKTHHAEGLVDQKCSHFFSFLILDTQEHVDSENI
jgi:hypothetical protein